MSKILCRSRAGRAILHFACAARCRNVIWHLRGAFREFSIIRPRGQKRFP